MLTTQEHNVISTFIQRYLDFMDVGWTLFWRYVPAGIWMNNIDDTHDKIFIRKHPKITGRLPLFFQIRNWLQTPGLFRVFPFIHLKFDKDAHFMDWKKWHNKLCRIHFIGPKKLNFPTTYILPRKSISRNTCLVDDVRLL